MKILTVRPPSPSCTTSDVLANTFSLAPRKGFWDDFKGDFFNHVPEINKNLSSLGLPNLGKGSV
jgi:hypothetical protein